jgi:hypothetical protein
VTKKQGKEKGLAFITKPLFIFFYPSLALFFSHFALEQLIINNRNTITTTMVKTWLIFNNNKSGKGGRVSPLLLGIITTHQQSKIKNICYIAITRNLSSQPSFVGKKVTPFKSPSSCSSSLKS